MQVGPPAPPGPLCQRALSHHRQWSLPTLSLSNSFLGLCYSDTRLAFAENNTCKTIKAEWLISYSYFSSKVSAELGYAALWVTWLVSNHEGLGLIPGCSLYPEKLSGVCCTQETEMLALQSSKTLEYVCYILHYLCEMGFLFHWLCGITHAVHILWPWRCMFPCAGQTLPE